MNYLYHFVPKNLQGNTLYPLNELKEKYPLIYQQQMSKYIGREHIREQQIPKLNCLWNDVLHFSAVNPKEIKQALLEAGRPDFEMNYYQIDPNVIEPEKAVIYLYMYADNKIKMNEKNFIAYDPNILADFSSMPKETKNYYKEMTDKGERPMLYHRIPHILYQGTLDLTGLTVITI